MKTRVVRYTALSLIGLIVCLSALWALAEEPPAETPAPPTENASVGLIPAYQRADQPGMYIEVVLRSNAASRMQDRLRKLISDGGEALTDDLNAGAEGIIDALLVSTRGAAPDLLSVQRGSSASSGAVIQVPSDYQKSYDFIAVSDASGRTMLYPVAEYDADVFAGLMRDALPKVQSLLITMMKNNAPSIIGGVQNAERRSALTAAFTAKIDAFTMEVEDIEAIFADSASADMGDGLTLSRAVQISSDLIVGGLGDFEPLPVEGEAGALTAAFMLTANEDATAFEGVNLPEPLTVDQIKAHDEPGASLWLNENRELVYIKAAQSWLSADAAQIRERLRTHGGRSTDAAEDAAQGEDAEDTVRSEAWKYVLMGIGSLVVILAAALIITRRRTRSNRTGLPSEADSHVLRADYIEDEETMTPRRRHDDQS